MPRFAYFIVMQTLMFGIQAVGAADAPPNFSGTWKMDPSRSESAHQAVPIGTVVLVVKQTSTDLSIETRRTEAGKTTIQSERLVYKLNGAESRIAAQDQGQVKTKAHWDGPKLVVETERTVHGASVTTRDVHTLNSSGKELKVEKTLTVQHGYQSENAKNYGSGTDVFVKSVE